MYNTIKEYLRKQHFRANPFATTNAEEETEFLPSFFVRFRWFDWLVGEPQYPRSLILFAPRGYGKTSHRLEVARIAEDRTREHRSLVVVFDDVNLLLRDGLEYITIEKTYLPFICRKTLQALKEQVERYPEHMERLKQGKEDLARLCALLRIYAPRRPIKETLVDDALVASFEHEYQQTPIGPREWLREELFPLVKRAGFSSVYILLDGLDEAAETQGNTDAMLKLLSPLLNAPGLLQGCGFAFKFFLPSELEQCMREQNIGRLDRIPNRSFEWDKPRLSEMLSRRLQSYSRDERNSTSYVNCFQDLCEVDYNVNERLVDAACCLPRSLIDLARSIVEHHCEKFGDADLPIDGETIDEVFRSKGLDDIAPVSIYRSSTESVADGDPSLPPSSHQPSYQPSHQPSYQHNAAPMASLDDGIPRLFLDIKGDIWLGEQRIDSNLPRLLRKSLDYLWNHRDRFISYDEFLEMLYGDSLPTRADPIASSDKIIKRLRKHLEGKTNGSSHRYIEIQTGKGYLLRNFREEEIEHGA